MTTNELMTIERVAALRRVPLFRDVPGRSLVGVARLLEEQRAIPGEVIIERGALEDWMFVLADGRVRVHLDDQTLAEVESGGVFGELAVLAPAPRAASVTAIEPTLLLRLRRGPFEELLEDHPEIARMVFETLARQLQESADRAAVLPKV